MNSHSYGKPVAKIDKKSNSTAGAVEVEANIQEQDSDHVHFRQEQAAETLTCGEMQRIAFITLEHALVTLQLAIADVGKLASGYRVTLSTAVLAPVTLVRAFPNIIQVTNFEM